MSRKHEQYSFEDYVRIPPVRSTDTTVTDVHHTISAESLQHRRLDNDKIYGRIMEQLPTVNEHSAEMLSTTNRSYSNFKSPMSKEIVGLGQLTRRESTNTIDRFQFMYNKNTHLSTYTIPADSRLESKDVHHRLKDGVHTRDEEIVPVSIIGARDYTNTDRSFGNVATTIQPPSSLLSLQSDNMKSGRYSGIDNNKLFKYQSEHMEDTAYSDAFLYANEKHLNPPRPHQFPCSNISDIGALSRYSLPDDDRYVSRTFQNAPNRSNTEALKLGNNLRVFPDTTSVETNMTRHPKSHNNDTSVENYAFKSVPFKDSRQRLSVSVSFSSMRDSSRKSSHPINEGEIVSSYVLSSIGTKAPRKPLLKEPSIGKNTTILR